MIILGLSEGAFFGWIGVVVTVLGVFISASHIFIRYKQKADNADTMKTVDAKIIEELEPVIKKINDNEQDFKDFKKQEIEPMKAEMNSLICKTSVMDTKIDSILIGIDDIKKLFEKSDKQIDNVWKVMQTKQDKK